ncbi:hypothetical protein ACSBOB_17255 [Mesorhizobium sp. ASY16-5R]|uniref:hypothetical protein n=1 Tax=Mesorhizobium sp. ASY16-5R TaxID=3445772 RepID=UPI003FA107EA
MADLPEPTAGLVIRYSYLWRSDYLRGLEEGQKDRPCAIVLVVKGELARPRVTVLPITHRPPSSADEAVEIPADTKRRLGLDDERSWVILTEANRFFWPGPDLRRASLKKPDSFALGELPYGLFMRIRKGFLEAARTQSATTIVRSE